MAPVKRARGAAASGAAPKKKTKAAAAAPATSGRGKGKAAAKEAETEPQPAAETPETQQEQPAEKPQQEPRGKASAAPRGRRAAAAAAEPAAPPPEKKQPVAAAKTQHQPAAAAGEGEEQAGTSAAAGGGPAQQLAGALPSNVLEEGRITFLYRPKVGVDHPEDISDIQRFYLVLSPTVSKPGAKHRLVVIGKKRMPSAAKHERFYAFVDAVSDDMDDLMSGLGAEEYDTKTRGHRHVGAARAVGRGVYELTREYRGVRPHTHLVYRMELPEAGLHHGGGGGETSVGGAVAAESGKDPTAQAAAGTAQAELAILPEGSYVVQIKNPEQKAPGLPSAGPEPQYTEAQRAAFGGLAWTSAEDTTLLDVAGTQLLIIGARAGELDIEKEIGAEAEAHLHQLEEADELQAERQTGQKDAEAAVAAELREEVQPAGHPEVKIPTQPAETGEMV